MKRLLFVLLIFISLYGQAQNAMFFGLCCARYEIDVVLENVILVVNPDPEIDGMISQATVSIYKKNTSIPFTPTAGEFIIYVNVNNPSGHEIIYDQTIDMIGFSSKSITINSPEATTDRYSTTFTIWPVCALCYDINLLNATVIKVSKQKLDISLDDVFVFYNNADRVEASATINIYERGTSNLYVPTEGTFLLNYKTVNIDGVELELGATHNLLGDSNLGVNLSSISHIITAYDVTVFLEINSVTTYDVRLINSPQIINYIGRVNAWDITHTDENTLVTYDISEPGITRGISFKSDGTEFYVLQSLIDLELGAINKLSKYTMLIPWDISNVTYVSSKILSNAINYRSLCITEDGLHAYFADYDISKSSIDYYTMSSPWDISILTYNSGFNISAQNDNPTGLYVKNDGSLFTFSSRLQSTPERPYGIFRYDMSSNYYIISSDYIEQIDIDEFPAVYNHTWKDDGEFFYECGRNGDSDILILRWEYGEPFSGEGIRTAKVFDIGTIPVSKTIHGIVFRPNGLRFYLIDTEQRVYQFDIQ